MRLHHLEIQAFGPFPGTVTVDFDDLSASGLFLLTGQTGAGKTSVLDAICFALYGAVPGVRGDAKRLRSDTAPAETAPRVRLEVTLSSRRFRFTRSPAWQRPKRRGTGMTTEQTKVLCEERVDGQWQGLSTRADETGHLVSGLLGMTMTQFCQVALLPQGEFQGFLRAGSDERHRLLQQLFATSRFEEIERWVREAAREAGRTSQQHADVVRDVVSRITESVQDLPEAPLHPIADGEIDPTTGPLAGSWLADLTKAAEHHLASETRHLERARAREETARELLAKSQVQDSLRQRGTAAHDELEALARRATARQESKQRVAASREAAPLMPLHRLLNQQEEALGRARERVLRASTALTSAGETIGATWWPSAGPVDETLADPLRVLLDDARTQLGSVVPLAHQRRLAVAQQESLRAEIEDAAERRTAFAQHLEGLPAQQEVWEAARLRAEKAAEQEELVRTRLADAEQARETFIRWQRRSTQLVRAQEAVARVRERVQEAREHWLDLREARISGMAAELASALAAGCECPVCGSPEHPAPAARQPGTVTAADEKSARSRLTDIEFELTRAHDEERTLAEEVAGLRAMVGEHDEESLAADIATLTRDLDEAGKAAADLPRIAGELTRLGREQVEASREVGQLADTLARAQTRLEATHEQIAQAEARIAEVLAGYALDDLEQVAEALERAREALDELATATSSLRAAEGAATVTRREFDARLAGSSFGAAEEVAAAVLTDQELQQLLDQVGDEERRETLAKATLDDEQVRSALEAEPLDVAAATAELTAARSSLAAAQGQAARAQRLTERLGLLGASLGRALAAWQPVREAHRTTSDLAGFLEGKSVDNALRMRLSGYVLAWRLGQVVAAANERLARMSGRYTLVHTDRRGTKETRGGLSLAVRDDWSGEQREPATLSGGETFIVSLALALGLADVVTAESGGTSLDTLFVDEGFGSLDAESLDKVLDTLDELREGGRVVGVVSHVAEMRARIPVQLVVTKSQEGSQLGVRHGAGLGATG